MTKIFEWYDELGSLCGIGCTGHVSRAALLMQHGIETDSAEDNALGLGQHLWARKTTTGWVKTNGRNGDAAITVAEYLEV